MTVAVRLDGGREPGVGPSPDAGQQYADETFLDAIDAVCQREGWLYVLAPQVAREVGCGTSTAYRRLDALAEAGVIVRIDRLPGRVYYTRDEHAAREVANP